jgi:hypothetical protein
MNKLTRLNKWLNDNYHVAFAIGLLIGLLIMDLIN